jgi:hypothetical protein
MNALAHYHLLSARLPSISADEAARHRADAKTILERLEVIDEDRKERYRELGGLGLRCQLSVREIQLTAASQC